MRTILLTIIMAPTVGASVYLGHGLNRFLNSNVNKCIEIHRFNPNVSNVLKVISFKAIGYKVADCKAQYNTDTDAQLIPTEYVYLNEYTGHAESEVNNAYITKYGEESLRD